MLVKMIFIFAKSLLCHHYGWWRGHLFFANLTFANIDCEEVLLSYVLEAHISLTHDTPFDILEITHDGIVENKTLQKCGKRFVIDCGKVSEEVYFDIMEHNKYIFDQIIN